MFLPFLSRSPLSFIWKYTKGRTAIKAERQRFPCYLQFKQVPLDRLLSVWLLDAACTGTTLCYSHPDCCLLLFEAPMPENLYMFYLYMELHTITSTQVCRVSVINGWISEGRFYLSKAENNTRNVWKVSDRLCVLKRIHVRWIQEPENNRKYWRNSGCRAFFFPSQGLLNTFNLVYFAEWSMKDFSPTLHNSL